QRGGEATPMPSRSAASALTRPRRMPDRVAYRPASDSAMLPSAPIVAQRRTPKPVPSSQSPSRYPSPDATPASSDTTASASESAAIGEYGLPCLTAHHPPAPEQRNRLRVG